MITVLSRPQEELYENNPPEYGENSYYTSYWNAGGGMLPMNYILSTDKFPVNTFDSSFTISSVASNLGQAELTTSAPHGFVAKEWIEVSGTTNYDGIYQILYVPSTTTIVINVAYSATDTGSLIKYYNNYSIDVKVFSGAPSYHSMIAYKPLTEIGVLSYTPDGNNQVKVNVTPLVKDDMTPLQDNSQDAFPNDLNLWTAFYIEYRETYDEVVSGQVSTFEGTYIEDTYDNCNDYSFALDNEDFTTVIEPWTNTGVGETWTMGGTNNFIEVTLQPPSQLNTNVLYQEFSYTKNVEYQIIYRIFGDNLGTPEPFNITFSLSDNAEIYEQIIDTRVINSANYTNYTITFVPDRDYDRINIFANYLGSTFVTINLDFVRQSSTTAEPCRAYLFSSYSTRQFGATYGGNMGEYVVNTNEIIPANFMTLASSPVIWEGLEYYLSIIIPKSLFSSFAENTIDYGYIFNPDTLSYGDGNPIDQIVNTGSDTGITVISNTGIARPLQTDNAINSKKSALYDGGDILQGSGTLGYLQNAVDVTIVAVFKFTNSIIGVGSSVFMAGGINTSYIDLSVSSGGYIEFNITDGTIFKNRESYTTGILLNIDTWYAVIATYDRVNGVASFYVNGIFRESVSFTGGGNTIGSITGQIYTGYRARTAYNRWSGEIGFVKVIDSILDECDIVKESSYISSYYGLGTGGVYLKQTKILGDGTTSETNTQITQNDDGVYRLLVDTSDLTNVNYLDCKVSGNGICDLSETKRLTVNKKCDPYTLYLTWINYLGGWDYWNFTARKETNIEVKEKIESDIDVFADLAVFKAGLQDFKTNQLSSNKVVQVNSQLMNESQVSYVAEIIRSVKVIDLTNNVAVKVLTDSLKIKRDSEKLYSVSIDIEYPRHYVQTQ